MSNLIVLLSVWFILAEIFYFTWGRDREASFIDNILSQFVCVLFSVLATFFLVGLPMALAEEYGVQVYYWAYGAILGVVSVVVFNWVIGEVMDCIKRSGGKL